MSHVKINLVPKAAPEGGCGSCLSRVFIPYLHFPQKQSLSWKILSLTWILEFWGQVSEISLSLSFFSPIKSICQTWCHASGPRILWPFPCQHHDRGSDMAPGTRDVTLGQIQSFPERGVWNCWGGIKNKQNKNKTILSDIYSNTIFKRYFHWTACPILFPFCVVPCNLSEMPRGSHISIGFVFVLPPSHPCWCNYILCLCFNYVGHKHASKRQKCTKRYPSSLRI